ncbi:MAG: glucokinase [Alphaproteobacteria bacterium]|nr:glucokinase [Alphaproteobacteria bacterium]
MVVLLSDIGGTNIRFSILDGNEISAVEYYKTNDFKNIETALACYLKQINKQPQKMVFGVAGLVQNGCVKLTNADFEVNQKTLESLYPNTKIKIVNDFVLQGYGVLDVSKKELRAIGENSFEQTGNKVVLGPGTGLGSCFLIEEDDEYKILSSESGHTSLAPVSVNQQKILAEMTKEEYPLSFEDVISGSGLCRLYQAISKIHQLAPDDAWLKEVEEMKQSFGISDLKESLFMPLRPKEITLLAEKEEEIALLTYWYFFEFLGIYASNLALTIKADGGVYLVGNLLNQALIRKLLIKSWFRKFFDLKGVFSTYMKNVPVFLVEKPSVQIDGLVFIAKTL